MTNGPERKNITVCGVTMRVAYLFCFQTTRNYNPKALEEEIRRRLGDVPLEIKRVPEKMAGVYAYRAVLARGFQYAGGKDGSMVRLYPHIVFSEIELIDREITEAIERDRLVRELLGEQIGNLDRCKRH